MGSLETGLQQHQYLEIHQDGRVLPDTSVYHHSPRPIVKREPDDRVLPDTSVFHHSPRPIVKQEPDEDDEVIALGLHVRAGDDCVTSGRSGTLNTNKHAPLPGIMDSAVIDHPDATPMSMEYARSSVLSGESPMFLRQSDFGRTDRSLVHSDTVDDVMSFEEDNAQSHAHTAAEFSVSAGSSSMLHAPSDRLTSSNSDYMTVSGTGSSSRLPSPSDRLTSSDSDYITVGGCLGDKVYACRICDRKFRKGPDVKRHVRIHTGERPYTCVVCGKEFTQRGNMRRHMVTHTDID
jgi:hypothetical protein